VAEGEIWHGGDLATAQALFPDAPEPWIDLSTGINPIPYPLPPLPLSLWQRLPGREDEAALLAAARRPIACPMRRHRRGARHADPDRAAAAPCRPRGPVAVLGPTYAEHAQAWRKAGADVRAVGRSGYRRAA
jgi:cobalamin biosynthetic protein CobC